MKLSKEQLKALRKEGARYPRLLGYVLDGEYDLPIISASFETYYHGQRLYTIWREGISASELHWSEEDPRRSFLEPSGPWHWKWRPE